MWGANGNMNIGMPNDGYFSTSSFEPSHPSNSGALLPSQMQSHEETRLPQDSSIRSPMNQFNAAIGTTDCNDCETTAGMPGSTAPSVGLPFQRQLDIFHARRQGPGQSGGAGTKYVAKKPSLGFKNISLSKIVKEIGAPDLIDPGKGGIAVWNSGSLKLRGYSSLTRVEIIDEKVPSLVPVPHNSNVYIWTKVNISPYYLDGVLSLSPNLMYDQQKKQLIVRSKCIRSAMAIAALIKLYSLGKISIYQIKSYGLVKKYYISSQNKKIFKSFKKILKK